MSSRIRIEPHFLTLFLALSCGSGAFTSSDDMTLPSPSPARLAAIDHDLGPGSVGDDVRAVHGYLLNYGYLPNATILRQYPSWRPAVAQRPTLEDVYDDNTAAAVRVYQKLMHLKETGIVDAETRGEMAKIRCAAPDGIKLEDPSDKFSVIDGAKVPVSSKYYTLTSGSPFSSSTTKTLVTNAANTWNAVTNLNLTSTSILNQAKIQIDFHSGSTDPLLNGHLAVADPWQWTISVNTDFPWSTTGAPGTYDFQSAMLHEFGHVVGLNHGSWPTPGGLPPAMWPTLDPGTQRQSLITDDKVAVSTKYDVWSSALGAYAEDIGADLTFGSVWIISASDHSIWKWMGAATFQKDVANGDARRIAVDDNSIPWVAAPWGVYRRTSSDPATGTWELMRADCTTDVGVGHEAGVFDIAVWVAGCDGLVYKWLGGTSWAQDVAAAGVTRISVDNIGTPWVIAGGVPYHRRSNNPNADWYDSLGGLATDIGVGSFPYAWRTTQTATSGGYTLEAFDYQDAITGAPAEWRWIPITGSGVNVAVTNGGEPWVQKNIVGNNVFKTTK